MALQQGTLPEPQYNTMLIAECNTILSVFSPSLKKCVTGKKHKNSDNYGPTIVTEFSVIR